MTTISPIRVSMYDFLYQDTQPLVSLLADAATLSLSQSRLAMDSSLQAIISALLAYQQRHQGQAVSKNLFGRRAVKELRKYNSMNFATLNATLNYRQDVADALFQNSALVSTISERIATQIGAKASQVQILLNALSIIVLRELAILAEYSQLDPDEINKWFALQPQFLASSRFHSAESPTQPDALVDEPIISEVEPANHAQNNHSRAERHTNNTLKTLSMTPPPFDEYWHTITGYQPKNHEPAQDMELATGNYLKAIGRSPENTRQGGHNDSLFFAPLPAIALPHQRWLLQLAKISDIYLERNRLRITSEPATAPTPPLVSLSFIAGNNDNIPTTTSEKPIEYDESTPLWKNPVIIITLLVIAILSALAFLKYQSQSSYQTRANAASVSESERNLDRQQQDVAIVKVDSTEGQTSKAE